MKTTTVYLSILLSLSAIGSVGFSGYQTYQLVKGNAQGQETVKKELQMLVAKVDTLSVQLESIKNTPASAPEKNIVVQTKTPEPSQEQKKTAEIIPDSPDAIKVGLSCYEAQQRGIELLQKGSSKEILSEVITMVNAACPKE